MKTANYRERQTFRKYDDAHYLLYLNEQAGVFDDPEQGQYDGFAYTGEMEDGATMIAAAGVTDENRRDKFIAGLVGTRYSIDAQIATLANGAADEQRARELAAFSEYRAACKAQIDELLSR